MNHILTALYVVTLTLLSSALEAIEPNDAQYDGKVLRIPYLEFNDQKYQLSFIPTDASALNPQDCPVLCLKLKDATESEIVAIRDSATFDGTILSVPRVLIGDEVYSGTFTYLSHLTDGVYFSVSEADIASFFSATDNQNWPADELEMNLSFCKENSYRWDTPFPFGDFNQDGYEDIFIPIACYQGKTPDNGGEENLAAKTGWYLLCSNELGSYDNCTKSLFGTEFIDTSKDGGKGGLPYHHNTEEPKDLNGDGYLDFALTLNRDDGIGRNGYDVNSEVEFTRLINECFDGDRTYVETLDKFKLSTCSYWSEQYVFLSKPDGTYKNVKIPWGSTWTHSMRSIPNELGGYDLLSIGYDFNRVARIQGTEVTDITEIYEGYENYEWATQINPYVGGYYEFDNNGYWIANGVRPELVANIADYDEFDIDTGWYGTVEGISVWEWIPGRGFIFSDYYMPAVENLFTYKNELGNPTTGLYKRGIPQLGGGGSNFYNFMKQAVLDPEEGPILVVQGENSGFLSNTRRQIPSDFQIISNGSGDTFIEDAEYPVLVLEGFTVKDGKIALREKSVIEGDLLFNSPGKYFRDINNDGYDDMVTITGMTVRGGAYLNKNGTLVRVDTNAIMPVLPEAPVTDNNTATLFWPLRNNGTIDLIYMDKGQVNVPDWWIQEEVFNAGNIGVIRTNYRIDSLPTHTVSDQLDSFEACARTASTNLAIGWIWNCAY
ncbi:hypothetical protein N9A05_05250 [Gammaproteobacteria bacterium]|nr:hypothetical protein [Gammaproteobacteria bacterium]